MMLSYLKILRPSIVFLAAFAVLVGSLIIGYYQPFQILIAVLVAFLVSGTGNVTNDYYDYEIDRINKPKRVLPAGKMKRRNAVLYAAILYVLAVILTLSFLNYNMILLALINIPITFFYAWKIKRTPFGHFVDSWLASSAFLFGGLLGSINATVILLFSMAYMSNLSREITKGIEDMEGDKKAGAKTLSIVTGRLFAAWIAIFFIIFSVIISFIPFLFGLLNIRYLILVMLSDLIFVFSCFVLLVNPAKSQKIMKIAMFVAIIAFLVGIY
jgi:geranylgeranylglycerol-phosphate geranylgeranyltransferase